MAAISRRSRALLFFTLLSFVCLPLTAAVLPEDRADALYHSYSGGGVKINGPSILVRKKIGETVSVSGNYYVDAVSSASIDVVTSASPYSERRTQTGVSVDYLRGKTMMTGSYTTSSENDYQAKTVTFDIAQDVFGDLTTVRMGYTRGADTVGKRNDSTFEKDVKSQRFRLGVSQILTKSMLVDLGWEFIADEGFLNNPYRSVRYIDASVPRGYSYQAEVYPRTHTSNAVALRSLYYLPYRASLKAGYRFFADSWGIKAHTFELGYTHPLRDRWVIDASYRLYRQGPADFYSDLFPYQNAQNFMARDKELSSFQSNALGLALSYEFGKGGWGFIEKGSFNVGVDHIRFNYDDFSDLRDSSAPVGQEQPYSFTANVLKLFLSIWY